MKTADDEATRKAAWQGLRSLGPWVVQNGFCEMVKLRNAMARKLGYEDFYDYKVTQAEGFGKQRLFHILDTLLAGSERSSPRRASSSRRRAPPRSRWNMGWMMAGDAESRWTRTFPSSTRWSAGAAASRRWASRTRARR